MTILSLNKEDIERIEKWYDAYRDKNKTNDFKDDMESYDKIVRQFMEKEIEKVRQFQDMSHR